MKKKLSNEILTKCMDMTPQGMVQDREQVVVFRKGEIKHIVRIITYIDIKKGKTPKLILLVTNDFDMPLAMIVDIYRRRWQIESLFKLIEQNFLLRYFYGESVNAINIQIKVTLIAKLLMTLLQNRLEGHLSYSGLITRLHIVMMYYINLNISFEKPDEDMKKMLLEVLKRHVKKLQINKRGLIKIYKVCNPCVSKSWTDKIVI